MRTATLARIFAADVLEGQRFAAYLLQFDVRASLADGRFPEVAAALSQSALNAHYSTFRHLAAAEPKCKKCGRRFSAQEHRAGFKTCEHCDAAAARIEGLAAAGGRK